MVGAPPRPLQFPIGTRSAAARAAFSARPLFQRYRVRPPRHRYGEIVVLQTHPAAECPLSARRPLAHWWHAKLGAAMIDAKNSGVL